MGFQGNLKTMHLGDVFQNILQNRSAGNLRIHTKEMGDIDLFFMEGELTLFHSKNLEEIQWSRVLLAKGDMSEEEVNMIESQGIKGEEELAGIISSQIIGEDKAAVSFQHIVEEEIYELFFIQDCDFTFESATEIPALYTYTTLFKRTTFNTNMMLMEAARRSDEHSQIGDISSHEIFIPAQDKDKAIRANLSEEEWRIYDLVDGFRNVSEILRDSGSKRQIIVKILKKFLELQLIRISETKDLLAKASHLSSIQDYDSAAKIYRRLVDTEKAVLGHRELLAETFLKLHQKENAIMQLEIMVNEHMIRKDYKKANDGYQKILEIDPTKLNVHELIANNYIEMGKKKDAVAELKNVLQTYVDSGVFEKAKEVCTKLLLIEPEDLKVMDLMAKTCVNRGDRAQAVDVWTRMSEIYISRELNDDAIEVLKKIMKVEPSNDRAKETLNKLMIKMGKARTRQKVFVILGSIIIVLILAGSGFFYLEQGVKRSLEELKLKNDIATEKVKKSSSEKEVKDLTDQVVQSYEKFKNDNPYSLTSFQVNEFVRDVDAIKRKKLDEFRNALVVKTTQLDEEFNAIMASSEHKKALESIEELEKYQALIKDDAKLKDRQDQIKERISFLKGLESQANEKLSQINEAVKNNKLDVANNLGKEVLKVYGKTSAPDKILFYTNVASSEADSKVSINGAVVSRSLPLLHSYKPGETLKVLIQKDGYYDFEDEVSDGKKASVIAQMKRKILWTYDLQNPINASPIFRDGVLYLSTRNGRTVSLILDFNADTYKESWIYKMPFPSSDIFSAGFFETDAVYLGSSDKHIYSIDLAAGREYWKKKMAGPINSSLSLSRVSLKQDQKMLFAVSSETTEEGVLVGLDAKSGELEWQKKIKGRAFSDVLSTNSKVYVGTDQNKIVVVRASTGVPIEIEGKEKEMVPLEYKSFGQFKGTMILREVEGADYLFASSIDQNIYCFDEKTGNKVWSFVTNSPNECGLSTDDQNIYNSSTDGLITSIKINDSVKNKKAIVNWSIKFDDLKDPTQIFITDNILYVGGATENKKGKLLAIRKSDGKSLWTLDTPMPINARPLVVESRVFVGCDDKKLYVLKELK